MGLERGFPIVGPECVKGIEINPFAAELARVSVWIGEIQWMREHGFDASRNPILKPLETIECRDALLNADGSEAEWPHADRLWATRRSWVEHSFAMGLETMALKRSTRRSRARFLKRSILFATGSKGLERS